MLPLVRNKFTASAFGRAFIVTLFFVTIAALLFWLDYFRGYTAEITVLVVSKSSTQTSEDVAGNLAGVTKMLSFYDRVLAQNNFIDDEVSGYAPDKRKAYWNSVVSVTEQDTTGILVIRSHGDTSEKAKLLATQTAQTLFSVAGLYYNVKTDIDVRTIDGPFVVYTLQKPYVFVATSLLSSFFLTTVFFFLLQVTPKIFGKKKDLESFLNTYRETESANEDETLIRRAYPEFSTGTAVPWIDPKKFIPEKPQALTYGNQPQESETPIQSYAVRGVKHAKAPMNLPIASDDINLPVADETALPFEFEAIPEEVEAILPELDETVTPTTSQEEIPSESVSTPKSEFTSTQRGEPTQEEYKRRLNELLSQMGK